MGNVYFRKVKKLWIKYLQHGRIIREITGTDNIVKARRILRDREGDVVKGAPVKPNVDKITFDEAAADLLMTTRCTERGRATTLSAGSRSIWHRSLGIVA